MTRVQWNALCSFAEGALSVDIKESLLIKYSLGALFDKVSRLLISGFVGGGGNLKK